MRARAIILTAGFLGPACAGEDEARELCEALVVNVELVQPLASDIRSFRVRTEGAAGPQRVLLDVRIPAGETRGRLEALGLVGSLAEVEVSAYAQPLIRGRLLAEGRTRLDNPVACAEIDVVLAPPAPRDAGPPAADAGRLPDGGDPPNVRDGGGLDGGSGPTCPFGPDDDTLAYFAIEGDVGSSTLSDAMDNWQATLRPRGSTATVTDGPPGCGEALALFGGLHGVVDASRGPAPAATSVDFWVRFEGESNDRQGIISRDASGQARPGHFTVFRTCDNHVVLRIQDEAASYYRCSDVTIEPGRWTHIGVNLGSPQVELWVDGEVSTGTIAVGLWDAGCQTEVPCDQRPQLDITGNENPWVLGADTGISEEGAAAPVRSPLRGALDGVRFSTRRRTFRP